MTRPNSPPARSRIAASAWVARALLLVVVVAACLWVLRRVDLSAVWSLLRGVAWRPLAAAVAIYLFVNVTARVNRWAALLAPLPSQGPAPRFWKLASVVVASHAANNVLPGRMGELVRTLQLRPHYSMSAVVTSQVMEKAIEAASMLVVALPVLFLVPAAARYRAAAVIALGAIALLVLVALAFAHAMARRAAPGPSFEPKGLVQRALSAIQLVLSRAGQALRLMLDARTWLASLAWSAIADLADVAIIALSMLAVGLQPALAPCVAVFVAVNLSMLVPSTPAQVGVFEAAAVLVLTGFGIDPSRALGFAIVYHAVHMLPSTLAGVGVLGLRTAAGQR